MEALVPGYMPTSPPVILVVAKVMADPAWTAKFAQILSGSEAGVGIMVGDSLGLELGLVLGLSLGVADLLGWSDGLLLGWSVGGSDVIDG
jgi:hypothetical protein